MVTQMRWQIKDKTWSGLPYAMTHVTCQAMTHDTSLPGRRLGWSSINCSKASIEDHPTIWPGNEVSCTKGKAWTSQHEKTHCFNLLCAAHAYMCPQVCQSSDQGCILRPKPNSVSAAVLTNVLSWTNSTTNWCNLLRLSKLPQQHICCQAGTNRGRPNSEI